MGMRHHLAALVALTLAFCLIFGCAAELSAAFRG
jgi:hypothetical protein